MKAAILAGGFGTRMRPLTYTTPKPLLPILNVPMVRRIIDRLPPEVDGAVVAVNYLAGQIRSYFEENPARVPVEIVEEKEPLGTGGAVKNLEDSLGDDRFLVMNGDVVCDVDLRAMLSTHKSKRAQATIHVWAVDDPSRFGVVETDAYARIKAFIEKPPPGQAPSNLINAGTYVLEPTVLDLIAPGRAVSMEREVFPVLARDHLYAFEGGTLWVDAGKPLDYIEAHRLLMGRGGVGAPPSALAGATVVPPVVAAPTAQVARGALVGPNVCLGANVHIGAGARVDNSVLLDGAKVGEGATVEFSVIGYAAVVGGNARLARGTVVADHTQVEEGRSTREFEAVGGAGRGG